MDNNEEQNSRFEYTYSAPSEDERREINRIRNDYRTQGKNGADLERLKKLDNRVKKSAMGIALSIGIAGLLIFGLGMTMMLEWQIFVWGIVVSLLGIAPMILANPIYNLVLKRNKKKYGAEILSLSERLLKEDDKSKAR